MMKISIDGYEANVPQRLGSSQVAYELLHQIASIDRINCYQILLPNTPMPDLPTEREGWNYQVLKPNKFWTRLALPYFLYRSKEKPDLIFSPTHYIPRFSPVKRIVTIFDLAYLHFPEMFKQADLWKLKNWTKFSIENADHILTISSFTKNDILQNYPVQKEKITVAYPGYDKNIYQPVTDQQKIKQIRAKYQADSDYFIYIGTIQPRKNLIRLMESFAQLLQSHPQMKLLIVGKTTGLGRQGWMYEDILRKPMQMSLEQKIIFTGFVPTEELPTLLTGATAFILPSLWEGFGIPALEAMACGAPVIVSNVSSLPEVVGNAGLLVDPYSVEQITQAMRTVCADKKLKSKMSILGFSQIKKFGWEKMARTLLKIFKEVDEQ
ncbi:glycosyltransferase family 4 protein [Patescibacteria group bacterium]|nr:glycosyltransferase family 4 protein [Patescibacteria group bacterium]